MLYIIYIFFLTKTKDRVVMIGTHLEKLIVPKPEPVTIKGDNSLDPFNYLGLSHKFFKYLLA